jgi:hypothetical protein
VPQFAPGYYFDPMSPHPPPVAVFGTNPAAVPGQSYGPIWDIDPSLYERPYPRPPPELSRESPAPVQEAKPKPAEPPPPKSVKVSRIEFSRPIDDHMFDISSASDEEPREFREIPDREYPPIDPFPLDMELRRRVDQMLAEEARPQVSSVTRKTTFVARRMVSAAPPGKPP